jgi:hypothetical protein
MRWLDIFRFRPQPPIRDSGALAEFIDENSAFLVQKAIYEYSRARAGHYSKVLFAEREFQEAVERSRWCAYPLGLAMVAEIVDSVLHANSADGRRRDLDKLIAVTLSVFDQYPIPAALGEETWQKLRGELEQRLKRIGLHPPKRAMDVPEPYAKSYFDLMPIHEKLRGRDFPTTHNYLKVTLCNIHEELTRRIDAPAVAQSLHAGA